MSRLTLLLAWCELDESLTWWWLDNRRSANGSLFFLGKASFGCSQTLQTVYFLLAHLELKTTESLVVSSLQILLWVDMNDFLLFSLAYVSSETHDLQAVFFFVFSAQNGGCYPRRSLWRPRKLGIRIVAWPKPGMFCEERLGLELFRNGSVHEVYCLKTLITLKYVNS